MNWYYWNDDKEVGPITKRTLLELESAGVVSSETPIRPQDSGDWTTLAALSASAPPISPEPATYRQELPNQRFPQRRTKKTSTFLWIIGGASALFVVIAVSVILSVKGAHDETVVSDLIKEADRIAFQTEGERDWDRAVILLRAAVEKGNHEAEYKLGTCYLFGRGVPQDKVEAARFFLRSATGGYANAQYNLAVCYGKGDGMEKNEEKMLEWLKIAAGQKFPAAQLSLGKLYIHGEAVPQNKRKGIELINSAANQGSADAQYELSLCYEMENDMFKDIVQAYKWAIISIRSGITCGDKAEEDEILGKLRSQMTAAQISEGEMLANEWKPEASRK